MESRILEDIKKAEKEAGKKIERAESKRERIILDARRNAEEIEKQETENVKKQFSEKIRTFRERADEERNVVLEESRLEMERVRNSAEKNMPKAIEALKKEFHNFLEK